jgi:kynurenine formamidase
VGGAVNDPPPVGPNGLSRNDNALPSANAAPFIVDLSRPLSPDTPVLPGDPAVTLRPAAEHSPHGYEVTHISLGSHSGTHIDAPRHFYPEGAFLSDYPVERFVGRGVVLDVRVPPGGVVDRGLVAKRLEGLVLEPGDFVLLWTGQDPEVASCGPVLTSEAASLLVGLGVTLVGTDACGLDEEPYPIHRLLLGADVLLVEGLRNLDLLRPGRVQCVFLPLPVVHTDGAPIRAIAWRVGSGRSEKRAGY